MADPEGGALSLQLAHRILVGGIVARHNHLNSVPPVLAEGRLQNELGGKSLVPLDRWLSLDRKVGLVGPIAVPLDNLYGSLAHLFVVLEWRLPIVERDREDFVLHPGILFGHRIIQLLQDLRVIPLQVLGNGVIINLTVGVLDLESMVARSCDALNGDLVGGEDKDPF